MLAGVSEDWNFGRKHIKWQTFGGHLSKEADF